MAQGERLSDLESTYENSLDIKDGDASPANAGVSSGEVSADEAGV